MHAHLLVIAHVVLSAYQWFAPRCVGGWGATQITGNLTFSGFKMSISPPLGLHYESPPLSKMAAESKLNSNKLPSHPGANY